MEAQGRCKGYLKETEKETYKEGKKKATLVQEKGSNLKRIGKIALALTEGEKVP